MLPGAPRLWRPGPAGPVPECDCERLLHSEYGNDARYGIVLIQQGGCGRLKSLSSATAAPTLKG